MAITVYFAKVAKRRNSTLQATFSTSYDCVLKAPTSLDRPTFLISAASFDYNLAKYGDRYYFIDDIVSVRNGQFEVSCILDVLATYKTEILASTQYVAYSSLSGGTWLVDTRLPLTKDATVDSKTTTLNFLFNDTGFYVLSAVGENGCKTYGLDKASLEQLLQNVTTWKNNDVSSIESLIGLPPSGTDETTAINAMIAYMQNLQRAAIQTGFLGNAFADAPNCIRSCIWVPFFSTFFVTGGGGATIHLGAYDTGVPAWDCKVTPESRTASVQIPWQYNDWRRAVCEEVYLYLPLVGMVSIPSDEIVRESAINVEWSATATDGCIAYRLTAGSQVIGTYGANCSVNVPIGISQQASAGEITQSVLNGVTSVASGGISAVAAAASGNVVGAVANAARAGLSAGQGAYDTLNVMNTRHNSCIGGLGGGAGVGLDLNLTCFTVAHPTVINPSDMQATMGVPTMKPVLLSSLSGYCECVNAHVEAAAQVQELDAIDSYLNSGFYIE